MELVSHLGGPSCTADELQWAADIPAGKRLLEWLASQVPVPTSPSAGVESGPNHNVDLTRDVSGLTQTAVSPIALYSEEVDVSVIPQLEAYDANGYLG